MALKPLKPKTCMTLVNLNKKMKDYNSKAQHHKDNLREWTHGLNKITHKLFNRRK